MGGSEINPIKLSELQGEVKQLAQGADIDNSGAIDTKYEHSLFTQYAKEANVDIGDYQYANYSKDELKKSEKKEADKKGELSLADEQKAEAKMQGAMRVILALIAPEDRAAVMQVIQQKPKLNGNEDYNTAVGDWIRKLATAGKQDIGKIMRAVGEEVKANDNANTNAVMTQNAATQDMVATDIAIDVDTNKTAHDTKQIATQDLAVDKQDLKVDKKDLAVDRADLKVDKQDLAVDRTDLAVDRADLAVDIDTNATAHVDLGVDLDTNATAHRTEAKTDRNFVVTNEHIDAEAAGIHEHLDDATETVIDSNQANSNLANHKHTRASINRVHDLETKIQNSNLTPAEKDALRHRLTNETGEITIDDEDLDEIENAIDSLETNAPNSRATIDRLIHAGATIAAGVAPIIAPGSVGIVATGAEAAKKAIE